MRCAFFFVLQTCTQRPLVLDRHHSFKLPRMPSPSQGNNTNMSVRGSHWAATAATHPLSPPTNHRVNRLLYDSRRAHGRQAREMPQKALGPIVGLLCTGTSLVQVSRRLCCVGRPRPSSRGRGSLGLVFGKASMPIFYFLFIYFFLVRAQRNRDCSQSYCAWRQPTKVWTPQI